MQKIAKMQRIVGVNRLVGRIEERFKDGELYSYRYRHSFNLSSGVRKWHCRNFLRKNFSSDEECLAAAQAYQEDYCSQRGFYVNRYHEVDNDVIEMQLNFRAGPIPSDLCVYFHKRHLDRVLQTVWCQAEDQTPYSCELRKTLGRWIYGGSEPLQVHYCDGNPRNCRDENLTLTPLGVSVKTVNNLLCNSSGKAEKLKNGRIRVRYTVNGKRRAVYFSKRKYKTLAMMRAAASEFILKQQHEFMALT